MDKHFSIAIDGPSGAGKSTLAQAAAARFGFIHVDTGAIYRTVGLAARREGISPGDVERVTSLLPGLKIEMGHDASGVQRMYLNGDDVSELIRMPEISRYASEISAMPAVRAFLMDMQRVMADTHDVIMDGRDIGTVVLPGADLKVFLTAGVEKRAQRRLDELIGKGVETTFDEVLRDMNCRDFNDSTRASSPLRAAEDAKILDTSGLTLAESIESLCGMIAAGLKVRER
ncbi:MAG TPA: (d)CMP kinase [Clostridiales bacterium]|nr:(d)CMP kinase [Clostridiales bacterium]HBR07799.1 (d)CMP kinase [Clostridiales bacterium]